MVSTLDERYQAFLANLRAARARSGLTQSEAAQALRRPQSFVSRSENGERRVDIVEASDFAAVYGCRLSDLVPGCERRDADERV